MGSFTRPWRRYAEFRGRAGRIEYLLFWALFLAVPLLWYLGLGLAGVTVAGDEVLVGGERIGAARSLGILGYPILLFWVIAFVPALALIVRRLRDIGLAPKWVLLWLVIPIAMVMTLLLLVIPGTRGANRYGPSPADDPEALPDDTRQRRSTEPAKTIRRGE